VIRLLAGEARHQVQAKPVEGGAFDVTVDATTSRVRVEPVSPGVFLLVDGARRETFHAVRDGDRIHLSWRGQVHVLEEEREGARIVQRHHAGGLEAPMPGKVIKVSVEPGQQVRRGDEVLVIEAMKMENALKAPKDGTVKSVAAKVGDMVNPGVVLVEIE
jgi:acetyl/propionyl-CoA carboxylase alpha subunit